MKDEVGNHASVHCQHRPQGECEGRPVDGDRVPLMLNAVMPVKVKWLSK
jgi:hypothetical protein